MSVSLFDTRTPRTVLNAELCAKAQEILEAGRFILGPEVSSFESEFASYIGARHSIGVGNGTDALVLSLRALGIGPGDEVVVPSFSFYASAEAVALTGAIPVFADIDPNNYCLTVDSVASVLSQRTKAIIAVHLFGNIAPVVELLQFGLPVIEDAAQSAGSRLHTGERPGALGTVATFSFYPSKNLGCFGDGGAITTNDEELAARIRMLRFHGSQDKETFELIGHNSRLDELQAGFLRVMLPHLDEWSDRRRLTAAAYEQEGLGDLVGLPIATANAAPAWHLYVIAHDDRDAIASALTTAGIGNKSYYRTPIHNQPAMRQWARGELPGTEEAARRNLAIPIHPAMCREDVVGVVAHIREVLEPALSVGPKL